MNIRRRFKAKRHRRVKWYMRRYRVDVETATALVDIRPDHYVHGILRTGTITVPIMYESQRR